MTRLIDYYSSYYIHLRRFFSFYADYLPLNSEDVSSAKGLFPSVFNLAADAEVTANATCGQLLEPEIYCKLVEHVYVRSPQCGVSCLFLSKTLSSEPMMFLKQTFKKGCFKEKKKTGML